MERRRLVNGTWKQELSTVLNAMIQLPWRLDSRRKTHAMRDASLETELVPPPSPSPQETRIGTQAFQLNFQGRDSQPKVLTINQFARRLTRLVALPKYPNAWNRNVVFTYSIRLKGRPGRVYTKKTATGWKLTTQMNDVFIAQEDLQRTRVKMAKESSTATKFFKRTIKIFIFGITNVGNL